MVKSIEPVCCKTTKSSVGRSEPLWLVTLLPAPDDDDDGSSGDGDSTCYAVVVSANHSLLDGHGFYRLHNMLSEGAKVERLDPVRRKEVPGRMLEAAGGEPSLVQVRSDFERAPKSPSFSSSLERVFVCSAAVP